MRALVSTLGLVMLLSLAACGRSGAQVARGVEYFDKGAYEGALIRFRDVDDADRLRGKAKLRYFAYRGLSHYYLGEQEEARRYLKVALELVDGDANEKWLPFDVREQLKATTIALGLRSAGDGSAPTRGPATTPGGTRLTTPGDGPATAPGAAPPGTAPGAAPPAAPTTEDPPTTDPSWGPPPTPTAIPPSAAPPPAEML